MIRTNRVVPVMSGYRPENPERAALRRRNTGRQFKYRSDRCSHCYQVVNLNERGEIKPHWRMRDGYSVPCR